MAIEVKHGMGAAAVAAAGYGAGQGATRTALNAQGLASASRERMNAARLMYGEREAERGREFSLERMETGFGLQQQGADAAQRRRQEDFSFEFTTKQTAELEQLANAEAKVLSSRDFTKEEKAEVRRRIAARRAGIEPVERPKKKTPAELFEARTFRDKAGRVFALDERGIPGKPIVEPPEREPTWQDKIKAFQAAAAYAKPAEGKTMDPDAIPFAMKLMGMGPGGQPVDPERQAALARTQKDMRAKGEEIAEVRKAMAEFKRQAGVLAKSKDKAVEARLLNTNMGRVQKYLDRLEAEYKGMEGEQAEPGGEAGQPSLGAILGHLEETFPGQAAWAAPEGEPGGPPHGATERVKASMGQLEQVEAALGKARAELEKAPGAAGKAQVSTLLEKAGRLRASIRLYQAATKKVLRAPEGGHETGVTKTGTQFYKSAPAKKRDRSIDDYSGPGGYP